MCKINQVFVMVDAFLVKGIQLLASFGKHFVGAHDCAGVDQTSVRDKPQLEQIAGVERECAKRHHAGIFLVASHNDKEFPKQVAIPLLVNASKTELSVCPSNMVYMLELCVGFLRYHPLKAIFQKVHSLSARKNSKRT